MSRFLSNTRARAHRSYVRQTGKVGSLGSSSGRNQEDRMRLTERESLVSDEGVRVRGAAPEGGLFLEGE